MSGDDDISWTTRSATAATTLTANDYVLFVSPGAATVVITVPLAASVPAGRSYIIRRDATATNVVQLARSGADTINGSASNFAVGSAGAIGSAEIYSDGISDWKSLGTSV